MRRITIIGWQPRTQAVVKEVTHWPSAVNKYIAVAKAAREADVNIIEQVLVEEVKWTTDHMSRPQTDNS